MDTSPSSVLADLQAVIKDHPLPPVDDWQPDSIGESHMRIARNGDWYYQESKIERPRLVRLFASILRKDADEYFLVTPNEKLRIDFDDAPFQAVLLRAETFSGQQRLIFTSNMGDEVLADADHPITIEYSHAEADPSPYIEVRNRLRALMNRSVYYQLAELLEPHNGKLGVFSAGVFMPLDEAG